MDDEHIYLAPPFCRHTQRMYEGRRRRQGEKRGQKRIVHEKSTLGKGTCTHGKEGAAINLILTTTKIVETEGERMRKPRRGRRRIRGKGRKKREDGDEEDEVDTHNCIHYYD